jgi:hypothetical protein
MTDELDLLRAHMEDATVPTAEELTRARHSLQAAMDDEAEQRATGGRARNLRSQRRPSRRALLGVAAAVLGVAAVSVIVVVAVTRGNPQVFNPPTEALAWRLVSSSTSPFRSLPPGGTTDLQCVSDEVCYSPGANSHRLFRTTDGGQSWHATALIPGAGGGGGFNINFSCSGVDTCAVLEASSGTGGDLGSLVSTTDGGSQWSSAPIPAPTDLVGPFAGRFDCADALHCVVSVGSMPPTTGAAGASPPALAGTFLSTSDGGATWVQATSVPAADAAQLWSIKCETGGSCVAIAVVGGSPHAEVVGLTSQDGGLTWVAGPPASAADGQILYASCGDALHCMLVSVGGPPQEPYTIATTANGGVSWNITGPPAGWENTPTAVSCGTALSCWVAMSTYDTKSPAGAYSDPTIEVTHDFGLSWSSIPLPGHSPPIADVLTLSCPPTGDGCMGIGNLRDHFVLPPGKPHQLSGPLVISDLPGTNSPG